MFSVKALKFMAVLLFLVFIFIKKYFGLMLIAGLIFVLFKSGIFEKVTKKVNKFLGIKREFDKDLKAKNKFIRHMVKKNRNGEEI